MNKFCWRNLFHSLGDTTTALSIPGMNAEAFRAQKANTREDFEKQLQDLRREREASSDPASEGSQIARCVQLGMHFPSWALKSVMEALATRDFSLNDDTQGTNTAK